MAAAAAAAEAAAAGMETTSAAAVMVEVVETQAPSPSLAARRLLSDGAVFSGTASPVLGLLPLETCSSANVICLRLLARESLFPPARVHYQPPMPM